MAIHDGHDRRQNDRLESIPCRTAFAFSKHGRGIRPNRLGIAVNIHNGSKQECNSGSHRLDFAEHVRDRVKFEIHDGCNTDR